MMQHLVHSNINMFQIHDIVMLISKHAYLQVKEAAAAASVVCRRGQREVSRIGGVGGRHCLLHTYTCQQQTSNDHYYLVLVEIDKIT